MPVVDTVYLLWHGGDASEETSATKLLGVYSSEAAARDRIERAVGLPGFRDRPHDFNIDPYSVDVDAWPEGFRAS